MERAAKIYSQMLDITLKETKNNNKWQQIIYVTPESNFEYFKDYYVKQQSGFNLGDRLANLFSEVFLQNAKKVIVIGSDCPELGCKDIEQAFFILQDSPAVIGPAKDGGFYLFGVNSKYGKKAINILKSDIQWSSGRTLEDFINESCKKELPITFLPEKQDIDTIDDWLDYQKRCNKGELK